MRILVSGSSGLVGSALARRLEARGDTVEPLVRRAGARGIHWDPQSGQFDSARVEGADAVVHLAGENVAAGRWNDERKRAIRDSRVSGTRLLATGLAGLPRPPKVLVSASAIGFYGNAGDVEQTESSPLGTGFLAEVCRDWEAACQPAVEKDIRVVHPRIGLVLSRDGGALKQMSGLFKLGLGGRLGNGRQWMSWVTLEDLLRVIERAIDDETLHGPVNAVAPNPVRNSEFTATLAAVLNRPTLLPVPAFALRLALGEMADEMLLGGARVLPQRLAENGFSFSHPQLQSALRAVLA